MDGVSVAVKNTKIATTTNKAGNFSIRVGGANAVLVFTSVGIKTREVPVSSKSPIEVILEEDAKSLDNVIVVGYGNQKKADLTGAVEQVGSQYFEDRPVPNISRALQGVIPNLNIVQTDGRPITNPAYNVRGVTSIGAGGEALILIDGVEGDPMNLNPNDIESITVLKDAASAAIYGARGAFGVILITTKTPKKGKVQFTYSGNYTVLQQNAKLDLVTDGYLWTKMFDESYRSWFGTSATTIGGAIPFSQAYLDSLKYRSENPGKLPEVTVNPANGQYVYYGNTNWVDELYAKSIPAMEHSINISGASDKVDYVLSGRYYNQGGVFKYSPDHYNKYNLRFKGGVQVNSWLKLTGNTDYSTFDYKYPLATTEDVTTNFFAQRTNGFPVTVMFNPDGTLTKDAANGPGSLLYGKSVSITKQTFVRNTVGFQATPLSDLSIKGDFTYQTSLFNADEKRVPVPYSEKVGEIKYSAAGRSQLRKTTSSTNYYAANLYGEFRKALGDHTLKVLLGGNLESSSLKKNLYQRDDLILPDLGDFNLATGKNFVMSGGGSEWATAGVFYRLNYDFKNKYLLQLNGRYDGSSKFPAADQYAFFPSVSAGWKVADEKFLRNTRDWLDNLKLRASYGSLGNSQIAPYMYTEQLKAYTSTAIINGALSTYIQQPAVLANNLTWEKSTTLDAGIDADVLHSKLSASFDWYQRKTTDMITVGQPLPSVFGAAVPLGNNANLITKGFELTLKWSDQIRAKRPIEYDVRFTLADNNAYITKFYNPNNLITTYYAGQRVGDIWGYETEGLFTSDEDINKHADQHFITVSASNKLLPGDIKFKDLNGDGKIDQGNNTLQNPGDRKIIGNTRPRMTFGLTTNWKWNNFSLSAFFQGVGKRDWYPSGGTYKFWGQYASWYGILPRHTLEMRWTEENPNPNAYFPRYRGPEPFAGRELDVQSKYLQDASYIRLKNITLSYTLSGKLLQRLKISRLQFYVTGQNLWTYSPMYKITKGFDVEVIAPSVYDPGGASSGDGNTYPMLKSYTFGLNLSF
jgi:TonB-linked SusC/RagA family outer membrane protein